MPARGRKRTSPKPLSYKPRSVLTSPPTRSQLGPTLFDIAGEPIRTHQGSPEQKLRDLAIFETFAPFKGARLIARSTQLTVVSVNVV